MKKFIVLCLMLLPCSMLYAEEHAPRKRDKHKVEKREPAKPVSFVDRLMSLDKNHDGLLSKKELEAFRPGPMPGQKLGPPMPGRGFGYVPRMTGPKPNPWQQGPHNMQFPDHWKR